MDNLQVLWALVDSYRRLADELKADAQRLGGDQPVVDKIVAYDSVIKTLETAQEALWMMADREGHSVTRDHASKCRGAAGHIQRELKRLGKEGEL
jgi:hypothetical protein